MGDCWADGVTVQITNLMLQKAVCREAYMAQALGGLAAAVLLLCHISQDGLIVHITSGVLVGMWLFLRAVLCV